MIRPDGNTAISAPNSLWMRYVFSIRGAGRTRLLRFAGAFLLIMAGLSVAGCLQPTDTGLSSISLAGRWQYSAVETGPAASTLDGTLVISHESGAAFQGLLDVTLVSTNGESRTLAGTVTGSAPSASVIDFDVALEAAPRRHVGRLSGDTIAGTWLRLSGDGASASGTFSARRLR
jgi:hypothetical protein